MFTLNAQIICYGEICPPGEGYTAAGPERITVGDCIYDVCYCWRTIGGVTDIRLDPVINIVEGDSEGCFPYEWDDYASLMKIFAEHIIQVNPDNLGPACPPCILNPPPPPAPIVFRSMIWTKCLGDCIPPLSGICTSTYNVCCTNGVRQLTYVSSDPGTTCNDCGGSYCP